MGSKSLLNKLFFYLYMLYSHLLGNFIDLSNQCVKNAAFIITWLVVKYVHVFLNALKLH
jgi:hypothetical protein